MLVDWFTVSAQALNLVVLIWALKRFLYGPILKAIDDRERRIADELNQASDKMIEATTVRERFEKEQKELEDRRSAILDEASSSAQEERQKMLEAARDEVREFCQKREEEFLRQSRSIQDLARQLALKESLEIARKALKDLADTDLESLMIRSFVQKLETISAELKNTMIQALGAQQNTAQITTSLTLSIEQQRQISKVFHDVFDASIHVNFTDDPDLLCGIEWRSHGQKISWNLKEYLNSMELNIQQMMSLS